MVAFSIRYLIVVTHASSHCNYFNGKIKNFKLYYTCILLTA